MAGERLAALRVGDERLQVGGNVGSAIGPLLAAFVVLPRGQASVTSDDCVRSVFPESG